MPNRFRVLPEPLLVGYTQPESAPEAFIGGPCVPEAQSRLSDPGATWPQVFYHCLTRPRQDKFVHVLVQEVPRPRACLVALIVNSRPFPLGRGFAQAARSFQRSRTMEQAKLTYYDACMQCRLRRAKVSNLHLFRLLLLFYPSTFCKTMQKVSLVSTTVARQGVGVAKDNHNEKKTTNLGSLGPPQNSVQWQATLSTMSSTGQGMPLRGTTPRFERRSSTNRPGVAEPAEEPRPRLPSPRNPRTRRIDSSGPLAPRAS